MMACFPGSDARRGRQAIADFIRDILTITGDVVTRFQVLEDSFGVSNATHA